MGLWENRKCVQSGRQEYIVRNSEHTSNAENQERVGWFVGWLGFFFG